MSPTDCIAGRSWEWASSTSAGMKKLAAAPCVASTSGRAATTAGSEARMHSTTDSDVTLAAACRATGRPRWPAAKDTEVPLVTRAKAMSAAAGGDRLGELGGVAHVPGNPHPIHELPIGHPVARDGVGDQQGASPAQRLERGQAAGVLDGEVAGVDEVGHVVDEAEDDRARR